MMRNNEPQDDRSMAPRAERPLTDREVPLPGMAAADATAGTVHQWLDGEASEADARRADERAVEFWNQVAKDAQGMKAVKAPAHLAANIMAAIPVREPGPQAARAARVNVELRPDA